MTEGRILPLETYLDERAAGEVLLNQRMQPLQNKASLRKGVLLTLSLPFWEHRFQVPVPQHVIAILCLITLGATLTAGLLPFHVPENDVAWVPNQNAISIGKHGTILSSRSLEAGSPDGGAASLELWVHPSQVWAAGCILSFLNAQNVGQFAIEQDDTDLVLRLEALRHQRRGAILRVVNVFRRPQAFLTITSDANEIAVYVDGQLEVRSTEFPFAAKNLSGQMILANCPYRDQSWSGEIKGLALFRKQLQAPQVLEDYRSWTQRGHPVVDSSESAQALYLFREHSGDVVGSAVGSGPDLIVPKRFKVVDQLLFEPAQAEFRSQPGYLYNALLNVAGFVPLGIMLSLYFSIRGMKRPLLIAVLAGTAVSLTIEFWQSFIPTRYSGVTDLFTNTFGTLIGVVLCRWLVLGYDTPAKRAAPRLRQ